VGVSDEDSTFTMKDGTISGNTATSSGTDGSSSARGGGVKLGTGSAFIMEGGAISGNIATNSRWSGGGGVSVNSGSTFTMEGGTISANTAPGGTDGSGGGGVLVNGGSAFTMEGGTIYGKVDSLPGGTDASLANSAQDSASLSGDGDTVKWGTGGTYTKGDTSQSPGTAIGSTDDTLIAVK
jgi:hypothetical protein